MISLFFFWLIFREFKRSMTSLGFDRAPPEPVYKPYVAILFVLALLFARSPIHYWYFQRYLSSIATELADSHPAKVHCNTAFDSIFDREPTFSHASPENGEIVFQPPECERLMDYIDHPDRANLYELHSLATLTHESMHVRGELDEAKTECAAIQRNYRAAKLLGVPDNIARKNALEYYFGPYMQLKERGPNAARYFSDQCAPDKEMDEHLSDSTWIALKASEDNPSE
ncbi:MAG: hypothetical protein ACXV74_02450 [Methylobacter sp.]